MPVYQTPVHVIGGSGGSSFRYEQSGNGKILRKIGVWAGATTLRGIRIWMTGSDSPATFGQTKSSYQEYEFKDGERISRLSLWGNGRGTRCGGIRFSTTTGGTFFHHMTSWSLKQEYPIDVASGLCVGIMGRDGSDIDCLGFYFLKSIAYARMINVSYPTLELENASIVPVTLDSYNDSNNAGSISKSWSFSGSREVKVSSSWTLTSGIELHANVSVKAGIPKVVEVQTDFGWKVNVEGSYTRSTEETRALSWEQSGTLAPGQWISLQATTRRGNITIPYQGTMEITLQSGEVFQYPISSMYSGIDYSSVEITNTGSKLSHQVNDVKKLVTTKDDHDVTEQATKEGHSVTEQEPDTEVQECKLIYT